MSLAREKIISSTYPLPKRLKILASLLLFTIIYGMFGYILIFGMGPLDALGHALNTLALQHTPAKSPIGDIFQTSLVLVGVVAFWWVVWTMFDYALEGKFNQYFSEVKVMSEISKLRNHYIVCGSGRVGLHIAKLLTLGKKQFVLIDMHDDDVENAKKKGFPAIKGDPFEEETLIRCGLNRAKAIIAVMYETEKNILATLIAKQFNPNIKVYARTEKETFVNTLKKVGADHVIMPEAAGAIDIARAIERDEKEYGELQTIKSVVERPRTKAEKSSGNNAP